MKELLDVGAFALCVWGLFKLLYYILPRSKDPRIEARNKPRRGQVPWVPDGRHLWYRPPYCTHPEIQICNMCPSAGYSKRSQCTVCCDCRGEKIIRGPVYGLCHFCEHGVPSNHIPNGVDCHHPDSLNMKWIKYGVGTYKGEHDIGCSWFKRKPEEEAKRLAAESASWILKEKELPIIIGKVYDGPRKHARKNYTNGKA